MKPVKVETVWLSVAEQVHPCPHCQRPLSNCYSLENQKPGPGDITFCNGCAKPSVFMDNYQLRPMTDTEMAALPREFHATALRLARALGRT